MLDRPRSAPAWARLFPLSGPVAYNPCVVASADRPGPDGPAELVLVSSGPGEVSNWAVPMARAASAWAACRGVRLVLSLVLPPCQFASGQESAYARRQGLFSRVLGPAGCLAVVTGLVRMPVAPRGCVLHLGGDLWYSAALGRRLGYPAFAYVETPLIQKRAHQFERVFLPSEALADFLRGRGVPGERLLVVGDLRVDHLAGHRQPEASPRAGTRVALLPGSRRWILEGVLPLFLEAGRVLRGRRPDLSFGVIASPFLRRDVLEAALRPHRKALEELCVEVVQDGHLSALAASDLAITVPGTNTVELAILGVPMVVVLPLHRPVRIRTEGVSEWLGRIPGLGHAIKGFMARQFMRRGEFVAWPNRDARRRIVPELVGRVSPSDVAEAAQALLSDRAGLDRVGWELRSLYSTPPGVAERMLEAMAPRLGAAPRPSPVPV